MLRFPLNRYCLENRAVYKLRRRELRDQGIQTLPPTLLHALESFENDSLVDETFGTEFQDIYMTQKLREWDKSFFDVSDSQRKQMLTYI